MIALSLNKIDDVLNIIRSSRVVYQVNCSATRANTVVILLINAKGKQITETNTTAMNYFIFSPYMV